MISNQKRIIKICSYVDYKIIADIGSDHGYITKYLFDNNIINYSVVTDISSKCLDKAKSNLYYYKEKINFIVGDGLKALLDDNLILKNANYVPEQIIIAGMGGREIIKILSQDENKIFKNFILQPQKNVLELRKYLMQNDYEIILDEMTQDGNMFYNVLKVKRADKKQILNEFELTFGKTNLQNLSEEFLNYISFEEKKCVEILSKKKVNSIEKFLSMLQSVNKEKKDV